MMRLSHAMEMEGELRNLLKNFKTLVRAAGLRSAASSSDERINEARSLLIRYTEESIRVLRAGSPIGLAALLGALANTALIYALMPHLPNIEKLSYWNDKIAPNHPKPTHQEVLFDCSFFELIKLSQDIGLLRTVGLRRRIVSRILSVHGFGNLSADFLPSSDFGLVKNALHGIKTFRNILHPGKLLDTPLARSEDFFQDVVSQGVILIAFFTELLLSRDFNQLSTVALT